MTKTLDELFRAVLMNKPDASRKEQQDDFVAAVLADPDYFAVLARDYFDRMISNGHVVHIEGHTRTFGRTAVKQDWIDRKSHPHVNRKPLEQVRREREEAAARSLEDFEEMKGEVREFLLLDLVLPNGKQLRQATGADCAKAGGFFAAVGKAIKPTQVVDRQLTEGDLQNIRARFYQANEKTVA